MHHYTINNIRTYTDGIVHYLIILDNIRRDAYMYSLELTHYLPDYVEPRFRNYPVRANNFRVRIQQIAETGIRDRVSIYTFIDGWD